MKLDGRRESSNVEDRRGMSGAGKAGVGLGGVAIIAIMALIYLSTTISDARKYATIDPKKPYRE